MVASKNGFENILREILNKGAGPVADEWLREIKEENGRAPVIFEHMAERPETLLSHLLYKNAVLKTGTLEPKIVELISLAVSSALRCNYCINYHIHAALRKGANKDEILEAVLIGGLTSQAAVLADAYRTYSETMDECPEDCPECALHVPKNLNERDGD